MRLVPPPPRNGILSYFGRLRKLCALSKQEVEIEHVPSFGLSLKRKGCDFLFDHRCKAIALHHRRHDAIWINNPLGNLNQLEPTVIHPPGELYLSPDQRLLPVPLQSHFPPLGGIGLLRFAKLDYSRS